MFDVVAWCSLHDLAFSAMCSLVAASLTDGMGVLGASEVEWWIDGLIFAPIWHNRKVGECFMLAFSSTWFLVVSLCPFWLCGWWYFCGGSYSWQVLVASGYPIVEWVVVPRCEWWSFVWRMVVLLAWVVVDDVGIDLVDVWHLMLSF